MDRVTKSNVEGAFKRLHRAMEWATEPAYKDGKPNVGAVYLADNGAYGFAVEIIANKAGGVFTPFGYGWRTKREAFDTMAAMSAAVEEYKREH